MKRLANHIDVPDHGQSVSCGKCKFGLIDPPDQSQSMMTLTLVEMRVFQAMSGLLVFCDCELGVQYRAYLRQRYMQMQEDKYYSTPVIDADTRQPMIDEDGKIIPWLNATATISINHSSHQPTVSFQETK